MIYSKFCSDRVVLKSPYPTPFSKGEKWRSERVYDTNFSLLEPVRRRETTMKPQKILVVEQSGSGEQKVKGLLTHGEDAFQVERWSIDESLPPIIDDASEYLPKRIEADLVLDFLKHPDLSYDLANLCRRQGIPMVASGKKLLLEGVSTPPT